MEDNKVRYNIDTESNDELAQWFTGNPQVTQLKHIYRRTTHYRKYPLEFSQTEHTHVLRATEYQDAVDNIIVCISCGTNEDIDRQLKNIGKLTLKIGTTELLNVDGETLRMFMSLYPKEYERFRSECNEKGRLIIPLQHMLFGLNPIVLSGFTDDLVIECQIQYPVKCYCFGIVLTSAEAERLKHASETLIWQYTSFSSTDNPVALDLPINIHDMIVIPHNSTPQTYNVSVDGVQLLHGTHPLIYDKYVNNDVYYLHPWNF